MNRVRTFAIMMAGLLMLGAVGCTPKAEDRPKAVAQATDSTKTSVNKEDEGIEKVYDEYVSFMKDELAKKLDDTAFKGKMSVIEKNTPIMKQLNYKAKQYCGSSFYVESKINSCGRNIIVREYYQDGNYRSEQIENEKLTYLTVYNKAEDTEYSYEAQNDVLKKVTDASQKGRGGDRYPNGYFTLANNAYSGEFKTIDYNGKKVIYSENHYRVEKGADGNPCDSVSMYWYDESTGILIREEQKDMRDGKALEEGGIVENTLKPDQTFDEAVFRYDEKNKVIGEV